MTLRASYRNIVVITVTGAAIYETGAQCAPLRGTNSFHRCGGPPPSKREVFGERKSRACRMSAVAPKTLRAPSRRGVVITSGTNGRAMRAPTGYGDAAVGCKRISPLRFLPRCRGAHRAPADIIQTFDFSTPKTSLFEGGGPPQRWKEFAHRAPVDIPQTLDFPIPIPPSSREGDRPVGGGRSKQAVEGVRRRWKAQKTPPGGIFSRRGFFYALMD